MTTKPRRLTAIPPTPNSPRPYAHIPGVHYAPEKAPARRCPPLPAGCPKLVGTLAQLAKWIAAAGLWATPPSRSTLTRWKRYGLIATRRGATGVLLYDVPGTIYLLTPKD